MTHCIVPMPTAMMKMRIKNYVGTLIAVMTFVATMACGTSTLDPATAPDYQATVTAAVESTIAAPPEVSSTSIVAMSEAKSASSQSTASLCSDGKQVKTKPSAIYDLSLEQRRRAVCLRQSGQLWVPMPPNTQHAEICNMIKREYDTAVIDYLIEGSPLFSAQTKAENYIEDVMERTPQRFTPRETRSIMEDCGNLIYGKALPPNLFFFLEDR